MRKIVNKSGFTILELALAMAFISFLLLSIGFVSVQIAHVYQKGVTVKLVNSNGRELVEEFSRAITASRYSPSVDEGFEYTFSVAEMPVETVSSPSGKAQAHGAFCTGKYSYIWNSGYVFNPDTAPEIAKANMASFKLGDNSPIEKFRLLRVNDPGREICINYAKDLESGVSVTEYHASDKASNPTELFPPSESELALYDLVFYKPSYDSDSGAALFSGSFIIGTINSSVDILASGNFCTNPPDRFRTDFVYCSINKFNFAARATGGISS
ncbi:hypothetical protein IJ114_01170 [Candidatus Saccharibacteria bacterium]|nr:hypothetical protein [Candidatus Saccharibacteria bacterium]